MRMVRVEEEMEQIRFAERAARYFALHPESNIVADNDIVPGGLLALRCKVESVVVVKLDAHFEPTNYQSIIRMKRSDGES